MRYSIDVPGDLATQLRDTAAKFEVPGLAIAMAAPGRRAVFLHGEAELGSGRLVSEDTWFSVASLGKHVTAAAVLDLAQRGLVDLSAPIDRYLRDLPPAWAGRSVSSLLRHTSGLPEYLAYTGNEVVPEDRRTFMSTYGAMVPAFGESQGWIYTNTNYILTGFLIAQLSGQSYAEAVQSLFGRMDCVGAAVSSPQWARDTNRQPPKQATIDQASWRRDSFCSDCKRNQTSTHRRSRACRRTAGSLLQIPGVFGHSAKPDITHCECAQGEFPDEYTSCILQFLYHSGCLIDDLIFVWICTPSGFGIGHCQKILDSIGNSVKRPPVFSLSKLFVHCLCFDQGGFLQE